MAIPKSWKKFDFFDYEECDRIIRSLEGVQILCATAEGGSLIFGDNNGNVYVWDHYLRSGGYNKHKLFRYEVNGLEYIYHPIDRQRQYVFTIGSDYVLTDQVNNKSKSESIFVKVSFEWV